MAHRPDLRGIGVDLGAVDAHHPDLQQPKLPAHQENLYEGFGDGRAVLPPEGRDGVVVRVRVRRHKPHANIAKGRPLDPPRRKNPISITVDQKRQHHPRVVLGLARALPVHLERRKTDPLHGRNDEVRHVIIRHPVPKVRWQQKRLRAIVRDEVRHHTVPITSNPARFYPRSPKSDRLLARISQRAGASGLWICDNLFCNKQLSGSEDVPDADRVYSRLIRFCTRRRTAC